MLLVTGSLNVDITFKVPRFAPPKTPIDELEEYLGGSGGNAAVAAARVLGPGKVVFLGCVGDDEEGRLHLKALSQEGIVTNCIKIIEGVRSGKAFVAVRHDGETAIYSYYGANSLLHVENAEAALKEFGDSLTGVLITNPPISVAHYLSMEGRNRGLNIFWDPGSTALKGLKALTEILKHVDYLLPNEGEVLAMTGRGSVGEAIEALRAINPDIKVVVKRGVKGATLFMPTGSTFSVPSVKPEEINLPGVASTTGCGDALTGVFTAMKILNYEDREALRMAVIAASYNAGFSGPRHSPDLRTLKEIRSKVHD